MAEQVDYEGDTRTPRSGAMVAFLFFLTAVLIAVGFLIYSLATDPEVGTDTPAAPPESETRISVPGIHTGEAPTFGEWELTRFA